MPRLLLVRLQPIEAYDRGRPVVTQAVKHLRQGLVMYLVIGAANAEEGSVEQGIPHNVWTCEEGKGFDRKT